MIRLIASLLLLFMAVPAFGQGQLIPWIPENFPNASGSAPNALGFVCTYAAGTSTPLATYSDYTLMAANQNPIRLNSAGRPSYMSAEFNIYLGQASYKFAVYGPGTGNNCNGTTVGSLLYTRDNIANLAQLYALVFATKMDDKVCHASQASGANAGAKIATCLAAIPSTGGTVDARGLEGAQTATANPFSGVTKQFTLLIGCTTLSTSAQWVTTANGQNIVGLGRCSELKASASMTSVLKQDGSALGGNGMQGGHIGHLRINGNGFSTDGWIGTAVSGVVVDNVSVTNTAGAGFHCVTNSHGCVTSVFINPIVSVNYASFTTTPTYGIHFDDSGSSDNTIINSKFEGITTNPGIGIFDEGQANSYYGGTSEGNDVGIRTGVNGHHTFVGIFMETNTVADLQIYGYENTFINMTSTSNVANSTQFISATSYRNKLLDGFYQRIVLDAATALNVLDNIDVFVSLTDNSANTTWREIQVAGVGQPNKNGYVTANETITTLTSTTAGITTANITTANIAGVTTIGDAIVGNSGADKHAIIQPGNDSDGNVDLRDYQANVKLSIDQNGPRIPPTPFASLGTPANGTFLWCDDCTVAGVGDNTCAGSGSGAFAFRIATAWKCFNNQN